MKRLLLLSALTISFFVMIPNRSDAFGVPPQCAHGFGWLQAHCLNSKPWIHQHGPLYNYGPYDFSNPGYAWMTMPTHHYYQPAFNFNQGHLGGYSVPVQSAPVAHSYVPQAVPQMPNALPPVQPVSYYPSIYPSNMAPAWNYSRR